MKMVTSTERRSQGLSKNTGVKTDRERRERRGREGEKECGCTSIRVREASLLGTRNKRDECTRAGAQCCSHRNLPNDSTISLRGARLLLHFAAGSK